MRVLLLGDLVSRHGASRGVCEDLEELLPSAGLTVLAASRRRSSAARAADRVRRVWRWRRDFDVAVLDVFSGRAFLWAEATALALRRAGKPYVLVLRGGALPRFAGGRARLRVVRLLESAAAVTAPSGYLAAALRHLRPDLEVLPNPMRLDRYPCRVRSRLEPQLVWLRALHRVYAPHVAVEALARLRERHPEATLRLVGGDKGDGSLERVLDLAGRLGVAAAVEVVGAVPKEQVPAELARGDLFLNTARVDNAPVSVLEALACGLPVVTTDVGGLPYLVRGGREALLVPPDDPAALASAAERLLGDPALAERLSRAGRALAERHGAARVVAAWRALLERVTGQSSPAAG